MSEAKKNDSAKLDLSLIPLSALEHEARGFMQGAKKYGRDNYKAGLEASRLVAACLRHIHAWMQGEDMDPDPAALPGTSHLGNARCCLAMLLETQRLGTLKDDRYQAAETDINKMSIDQVIAMNTNRKFS